jgi:hypothetical protein
MALADLIKRAIPSSTDKTADAIARLTADLSAAQARADAASEAWAQATAKEQDEGGTDTSRSDQLDEDLSRALREVNKIASALKAAQARQVAAVANAGRAELSDRWARAIALAESRGTAAARLARSMEAFASDLHAFVKVNNDLLESLPESVDHYAAILHGSLLEIAMRNELQRLGVPWETSHPWGVVNIPPFAPQFEAIPQLIRDWRDSAMARATGAKG